MDSDELENFGKQFTKHYLANGFGSLPKSEIDLLVFHLILDTDEYRAKSNYEISTALKIPESRVKSMRLNSALRYRRIDGTAVLASVVERFLASEQFAEFGDGKAELSLEDPIEKREIENFLKKRGYHAEYALNTEILKISSTRLFELIIENVGKPKDAFDELVQGALKESTERDRLLKSSLTLKQKFAQLRKSTLDDAVLKSLIGGAIRTLLKGEPS